MILPQTGGCRCGKIRYEITGSPQLIYTCHCTDCQRITGSAFSMGIALPQAAFCLTAGEPRALQRMPDIASGQARACGASGGATANFLSRRARQGRVHQGT